MILPTKHIQPERALLSVGGELLGYLREPTTVSRLWDEVRNRRGMEGTPSPINYDWFILALDLLYIIGAVEFKRGLIRRVAP
jgi:hypothetical protein